MFKPAMKNPTDLFEALFAERYRLRQLLDDLAIARRARHVVRFAAWHAGQQLTGAWMDLLEAQPDRESLADVLVDIDETIDLLRTWQTALRSERVNDQLRAVLAARALSPRAP